MLPQLFRDRNRTLKSDIGCLFNSPEKSATGVVEEVNSNRQKLLPIVPFSNGVLYITEPINEVLIRSFAVSGKPKHIPQFLNLQPVGMQIPFGEPGRVG